MLGSLFRLDELYLSPDVNVDFLEFLLFVLFIFFECLDKFPSQNACLVLDLRVVHVPRGEPQEVENILPLIAPQDALDVWTDGDYFLYVVPVFDSDFVFKVQFLGNLDHEFFELRVRLYCFAIIDRAVLTAEVLLCRENPWDYALSNNFIAAVVDENHVEDMYVWDGQGMEEFKVDEVGVNG